MAAQQLSLACLVLPLALAMVAMPAHAIRDLDKLQEKADKLTAKYEKDKAKALKKAEKENWPKKFETPDGRIAVLQSLDELGRPEYYVTDNAVAADSISVDEAWPGGALGLSLDGTGKLLGIWDGGDVRASHQEFGGRVTVIDSVGNDDHATHVAGTMIAAGVNASAKGMAYNATLRSRDWDNDSGEMAADQTLPQPPTVSNHSYGVITGWYSDGTNYYWLGDVDQGTTEDGGFGYYNQTAADWDDIVYNSPYYLVTKSAGNDRGDTGPTQGSGRHYHYRSSLGGFVLSTDKHPKDGGDSGYDSIGAGAAMAKNILTVAAVNDVPGGYNGDPTDVVMSSFSGWGPTDDGRIKPDISANGIGLTSSLASGDTAYGSYSGTSMAAPNVAGALALLVENAQEIYGVPLLASTMKALVIHTADEAGPAIGPDFEYGWGLMNAASAAQFMIDNATNPRLELIREIGLSNGETETIQVYSEGTGPLKVTIAWTDPAGTPPSQSINPTNLMLVNDLDLRVIAPNGHVYTPWVLDSSFPENPVSTGDNTSDNVEQIFIQTSLTGRHQIIISHKDTLDELKDQKTSVVVSGLISYDSNRYLYLNTILD